MPTLPVVPQVIKFSVEGTLAGDPWANVLHWLYDGGPPFDADIDHFCATLHASWASFLLPECDPELTLRQVLGEDLSSTTGATGGHVASIVGSGPSGHIPAVQNCLLIHHQVARHYRGGHPRTYVAGISQASLLTARQWTGAQTTAFTNDWVAIQAAMDADSSGGVSLVGQVSVSYFNKAITPTPPHVRPTPVVDLILGSTAESVVATQRRRVGR